MLGLLCGELMEIGYQEMCGTQLLGSPGACPGWARVVNIHVVCSAVQHLLPRLTKYARVR